MNNTLEGINSRITEKEKWINDMKDRMMEITATQQNIGKRMEAKKMQEMFTKDWITNEQTNRNE